MILVDTSIWIDHLSVSDASLQEQLGRRTVVMHPFVIGEIACGTLRDRTGVLELLGRLPQASGADDHEVLAMLERYSLAGTGIGWVDAHLLAAVMLTPGAQLWTRDRRLDAAARALNLRFDGPGTQMH